MDIRGELLIGGCARRGSGEMFKAIDAASGAFLEPAFSTASMSAIEEACRLAAEAFDIYREVILEERARFLEAIAENIMDLGDRLIVRCMEETGLPRVRLEGERARTVGQLRMFAGVVRDGGFLDVRIDPAQPERKPFPRVDLRMRNIPLGPVAVFGASNFPLAFSVAGGDTASAFAAGCPVIVKVHPAHPGTSELVGRAIQQAVRDCGLPEGVFSLLFITDYELAQSLVADPRIAAVGFTGSRRGGIALMRTAAERRVPIPVFAEMSSINPAVLFPAALAARAAEIGKAFAASLVLGAGQFCTNPGLVLAVDGPDLNTFILAASDELSTAPAAIMLTPAIHKSYCEGVAKLESHADVDAMAYGQEAGSLEGQARLFVTSADAFLADPALQDEVFGASSLVVRCRDAHQLRSVLEDLEGQLTAALHIDKADHEAARSLLRLLERKVGRILINGFGTGVEVGHAMVHGGPYPSTADGRSTSVGSLAIERFLRPVCYQNLPEDLLPTELGDDNKLGLCRRIDGKIALPSIHR